MKLTRVGQAGRVLIKTIDEHDRNGLHTPQLINETDYEYIPPVRVPGWEWGSYRVRAANFSTLRPIGPGFFVRENTGEVFALIPSVEPLYKEGA